MVWLCVLVGFLATPSMFHQINFEYRAYVPELQTKKIAISEQLDALRSSSRELIAEGRKLGLDLRSRSDASYRRSLRDPSGLSPIEPTEVLENEERMTSDDRNAAARRNEIKNSFAGVQAEIENKFEDLAEIDASIFVYSSESNNAFLIARALALGALGALAARLSKFVDGKIGLSGLQPDDVNRIRISMFVGALVSVVVLGLSIRSKSPYSSLQAQAILFQITGGRPCFV